MSDRELHTYALWIALASLLLTLVPIVTLRRGKSTVFNVASFPLLAVGAGAYALYAPIAVVWAAGVVLVVCLALDMLTKLARRQTRA